jgi:Amt family ammonium transporter
LIAESVLTMDSNFAFRNVLGRAIPEANNKVPEIVFATYQMLFADLVPAVLLGAACERSRVVPAMIFVFCWVSILLVSDIC